MEPEQWAPCAPPWSDRYEVSDRGNVRRRWNGKPLKLQRTRLAGGRPGYVKVWLFDADRVGKFVSVHRLVAFAFVPGAFETADVNHRDLDKANNAASNLEWVPHRENIRHGMAAKPEWRERLAKAAKQRARAVVATDAAGIEAHYPSIREAAKAHGDARKAANIHHALSWGGVAYGMRWRYA